MSAVNLVRNNINRPDSTNSTRQSHRQQDTNRRTNDTDDERISPTDCVSVQSARASFGWKSFDERDLIALFTNGDGVMTTGVESIDGIALRRRADIGCFLKGRFSRGTTFGDDFTSSLFGLFFFCCKSKSRRDGEAKTKTFT